MTKKQSSFKACEGNKKQGTTMARASQKANKAKQQNKTAK